MTILERKKDYNLDVYLNDYAFHYKDDWYLSSFRLKNKLTERDGKLFDFILSKNYAFKLISNHNGLMIIQFNVNRFVSSFEKITGLDY